MDDLFAKVKGKGEPAKEEKKPSAAESKEKPKEAAPEPKQAAQQPKQATEQKPNPDTPYNKTNPTQEKIETMQDKITLAKTDEEMDEEQEQSEMEKRLEQAQKELIDSTGSAKIYKIPGQDLLYYWAPVTRPLGAERQIINTIKEAATRIITISPYKVRDPEERRNVYFQKIVEILRESPELKISANKIEFYAGAVVREMVGYGLIDTLIKDENLEEIMVIGPKTPVYVFHRKYGMMLTNIEFFADSEIQDLINRIARQIGRRVDLASPLLDARLPDGSRVNATMPPASVDGSTLTIRKFRQDPYSITDLIRFGTINSEVAAFLWLCVEGMRVKPANILISGGTGSGKTTTLNVLASFIPDSERIISIEDTAELKLAIPHWVRMEARPPGLEGTGEITLDILTKNSLRMRPDRIIVGEIRHAEAFALFTAMNTGHEGCLGTVHANSPQETLVRVTSPPMNVPEVMLAGLNFVIVQHRLHDKRMGTIRRMTEISEVLGALDGKPRTETIFRRDAATDSLIRTKAPIQYFKLLEERTGYTQDQIIKEIEKRREFLEKLADEKNTDQNYVSKQTRDFIIAEK